MDLEDRRDPPTGRQIQKARRTLKWNATRLADVAGVSHGIIENWEAEYRVSRPIHREMVRATLEAAGFRFLDDSESEKDRVVWAKNGEPVEEPPLPKNIVKIKQKAAERKAALTAS